jgi:hypothetical protein
MAFITTPSIPRYKVYNFWHKNLKNACGGKITQDFILKN